MMATIIVESRVRESLDLKPEEECMVKVYQIALGLSILVRDERFPFRLVGRSSNGDPNSESLLSNEEAYRRLQVL